MSIIRFIIWISLLNNSANNLELPKDWSFLDFILAFGIVAIASVVCIALGVGIAILVMSVIDWIGNKYRENIKHKK